MSSALGSVRGPHTPYHYHFGPSQSNYYTSMSSPLAQSSSSSSFTRFNTPRNVEDGEDGNEDDDDDDDDDDDLTPSHAPSSVVKESLTRVKGSTLPSRLRRPQSNRSSPRQMLTPGPLSLSRPSGNDAESSASARFMKQQFRLKCQEAMAQDRKRDRERKVAQSRNHSGVATSVDSEEEQGKGKSVLFSDDLSSSDYDDRVMDDRELKLARRILAGDYQRMLREQERSGQAAVGWLDPDEVAWLEEEIRREEIQMNPHGVEPPADMIDEDEELFAQFEHAQNTIRNANIDEGSDLDYNWANEDEWLRVMEQLEGEGREDTIMSES